MDLLYNVIIFLFGLCIGSFLNVVIMRLETGENPAKGRSHCPNCQHGLAWYDLVPVLSFLWLRGTCRYCRAHISIQYPLVELATAVLFLLIFTMNAFIWQTIFLWVVASCLIVIFVYDLKFYLIPDVVLFPAIGIAFVYRLVENFSAAPNYLLAAGLAAGFFLAIYLISKGAWMGFGDVKLALLLGLLLGFPHILLALFLAFLLGAIIGVAGMAVKNLGLKSEIPFAPFLILGTGIAFFWGSRLINWYMGFFM